MITLTGILVVIAVYAGLFNIVQWFILVVFAYEIYNSIKNWYYDTLTHFLVTYMQDLNIEISKGDIPQSDEITYSLMMEKYKEFAYPYTRFPIYTPTLYKALTYNYRRQYFITRARRHIGDRIIPLLLERGDEFSREVHKKFPGADVKTRGICDPRNNGKTYVVINMCTANWTIVSKIMPEILGVELPFKDQLWETFATQLTRNEIFLRSRNLRETCVAGVSMIQSISNVSKRIIFNKLEHTQKCITTYISRKISDTARDKSLPVSIASIKGDEVIVEIFDRSRISDVRHMIDTEILDKMPILSSDDFRVTSVQLNHHILEGDQMFVLRSMDDYGDFDGIYNIIGCSAEVKRKYRYSPLIGHVGTCRML